MSITALGVIAVLLALACIIKPRMWPYAIASSCVVPSAAALSIGELYVSPFYLFAIIGVALTAMEAMRRNNPTFVTGRINSILFAFLAYTIVVTFVSPFLFAGTPVFSPSRGIDSQVGDLTSLAFTESNVAQVIYLVLGIAVALRFRDRGEAARAAWFLFTFGLCANVFAQGLRQVGLANSVNEILYNRSDRYYAVFEASRVSGTFSEPSSLGTFTTVASTFFLWIALSRAATVQRRAVAGVAAAVSAALTLATGSGTALAATTIMTAALVVRAVLVLLRSRDKTRVPLAIAAATGLVPLGIFVVVSNEDLTNYVIEKLGSGSGLSRGAADQSAIGNLWDSFGLGLGLGSVRPSSMFTMLLATVGLIGTTLFAITIVIAVRRAAASEVLAPTAWALLALVICKIVAGPDLSAPLLWTLLGICMSVQYSPVVRNAIAKDLVRA